MPGFFGLFEALISGTVDVAGNGAIAGGKGALLAGARKIGWASGSAGRQGKRLAGHSLSSKSLGSGGSGRANLHNYDPKSDYLKRTRDSYQQARKCGSGVLKNSNNGDEAPAKLFGRPGFDAPDSPLGRYGSKWCKSSGASSRSLSSNLRLKR